MDAKAQTAKGDARINIVVEVIMNTRFERLKRMLEVRDMRRNDGRVQLREEATAILAALDAHDLVLAEDAFEAACNRAALACARGEQP